MKMKMKRNQQDIVKRVKITKSELKTAGNTAEYREDTRVCEAKAEGSKAKQKRRSTG